MSGIKYELSDDQKKAKLFMKNLTAEFSDYVADAVDAGVNEMYEDHLDFLRDCLTSFIESKEDEEA